MRSGSAVWGLAFVVACSAPPDPTYPGREVIGPPPPASSTCEPPFPMNVGQDVFVLADLDQGVSCDVFVERDECAVGIFRDCTDNSMEPREWQGRLLDADDGMGYDPTIRLTAKFHENAARLPRSPMCCGGGLYPRGDGEIPTYALLACNDGPCGNYDQRHTGFFLEEKKDFDPSSLLTGEVTLEADASIGDMVFSNGALWSVVSGTLRRYAPPEVSTTNVSAPGTTMLRRTTDDTAIYLVGTDVVRVNTMSGSEITRSTLASAATAVAVTSEGVLVAYDDIDQSVLVALDLDTLAPRAAPAPVGRYITGLAPMDQPTVLAVATVRDNSKLYTVTATPTLALNANVDFPTVRGMELGDIVPRNPILIDGHTVGMIAACYEGAPLEHCYYEVDVMTEAVARVGVVDVENLFDVAYDFVSNRLVFSTGRGVVAFVDRGPSFRPRLQEQPRIGDHRLGAVAVDPATARAYVAQSQRGVVSVVQQPN